MAEEEKAAAREWLGRREALYKAESDSARLLKRPLVSSSSLLSVAPELIRINDSEDNPLKVLRFHEKRLGVGAIVEDGVVACKGGSFQPIGKEDFYQSFVLEKVPTLVEESVFGSPRSRTSEPLSELVHGLVPVSDASEGSTKRFRLSLLGSSIQGHSRSNSPVPSTIGPTIEATSPSATPAKSPTTQLPPSETRSAVTTNASNPSNSNNTGPSPPRKGSIATLDPEAMIKESTYLEPMSLEALGEPLVSKSQKGQWAIPPKLKHEYERILNALESIGDWPLKGRALIRTFRQRGVQNGNPFIDFSLLMPSSKENSISSDSLPSLDLKLIRRRVNDQTHYRWLYMLEKDLRDMCSQLKDYFKESDVMSTLVDHFSACVEAELKTTNDALRKELV